MDTFLSFIKIGNRLTVLECLDDVEWSRPAPTESDEVATICRELEKSTGLKVERKDWSAQVNFLPESQLVSGFRASRNISTEWKPFDDGMEERDSQ